MVRIELTNIIIDNFTQARRDPSTNYVHILTHIHTDHLKGLSDSWNFGPIYCSQITANLLLTRFPSLRCIMPLELQTQHTIKLSPSLQVCMTFFDANHCAGAVLVLLEGYMGTILHTGDMRYDKDIFQHYHHLYPNVHQNNHSGNTNNSNGKSSNKSNEDDHTSLHIDTLFFDNTFLNPRFNFPSAKDGLKLATQYVLSVMNTVSRLYIGLDSYGKEEVLVHLAKETKTLIVVDETRYEVIQAMGLDQELFTTNKDEGIIQVQWYVDTGNKQESLSKNTINRGECSGDDDDRMGDVTNIPYEWKNICMNTHLYSVYLTALTPIINRYMTFLEPLMQGNEMEEDEYDTYDPLYYHKQLEMARKVYCVPMSPDFELLINNKVFQLEIMERLKSETSITLQQKQGMAPVEMQFGPRKKYKLQGRKDQEEIQKFKQKITSIKQLRNAITISEDQIYEEESQQSVKKRIQHQTIVINDQSIHQDKKQQQQTQKKISEIKKIKGDIKQLIKRKVNVFDYIKDKGSNECAKIQSINSKSKAKEYLVCDRHELKNILEKLIESLKI